MSVKLKAVQGMRKACHRSASIAFSVNPFLLADLTSLRYSGNINSAAISRLSIGIWGLILSGF
ncbi:protein of unknown function [Candidatus Methylomirabilis oxygeniifera]|uniref:Uncharacterized protein n=1 Tax=Methylomirabilis oxygeniifera TaxID=671143 RepID=D5MKD2_METO1|nr:protein of unknown function [Candidatus Methylomirabilis oxyfera]